MPPNPAPPESRLADLAARIGATLDGDGERARRSRRHARERRSRRAGIPGQCPVSRTARNDARQRGDRRAGARGRHARCPSCVHANPYAAYASAATLLHPAARAAAGVHRVGHRRRIGARRSQRRRRCPRGDRRRCPDRGARADRRRMRRWAPSVVARRGRRAASQRHALRAQRGRCAHDRPCRRGDRRRRLRHGGGRRALAQDPAGRTRGASAPTARSARTRRSIAAPSTTR